MNVLNLKSKKPWYSTLYFLYWIFKSCSASMLLIILPLYVQIFQMAVNDNLCRLISSILGKSFQKFYGYRWVSEFLVWWFLGRSSAVHAATTVESHYQKKHVSYVTKRHFEWFSHKIALRHWILLLKIMIFREYI